MKRITAVAHPLLRRVVDLMESATARREAGLAVLEGIHLLETCIAAKGADCIHTLLFREDLPSELVLQMCALAPQAAAASVGVSAFRRLSPVAGDGGVIAIVRILNEPKVIPSGLEIWLDGVQDPGNAGGIVRTAAAAGAAVVVFGSGSADPWSPKCLRGGMGGHFLCTVVRDDDLLARAGRYQGSLLAAVVDRGEYLYNVDLSGPVAILLGAEGRGLSPELAARAGTGVKIPMAPGTESLNVGAAAAVICFERVRQVRMRGR